MPIFTHTDVYSCQKTLNGKCFTGRAFVDDDPPQQATQRRSRLIECVLSVVKVFCSIFVFSETSFLFWRIVCVKFRLDVELVVFVCLLVKGNFSHFSFTTRHQPPRKNVRWFFLLENCFGFVVARWMEGKAAVTGIFLLCNWHQQSSSPFSLRKWLVIFVWHSKEFFTWKRNFLCDFRGRN